MRNRRLSPSGWLRGAWCCGLESVWVPAGSPLCPSPAAPPARRGPRVGKRVKRGQIWHPEMPNCGETPGCHRLCPACCAPSLAPHPRGCFEFLRRRNQSQALGCGARPSQERWRKPPPPLAGTIPPRKKTKFLPWPSRGGAEGSSWPRARTRGTGCQPRRDAEDAGSASSRFGEGIFGNYPQLHAAVEWSSGGISGPSFRAPSPKAKAAAPGFNFCLFNGVSEFGDEAGATRHRCATLHRNTHPTNTTPWFCGIF